MRKPEVFIMDGHEDKGPSIHFLLPQEWLNETAHVDLTELLYEKLLSGPSDRGHAPDGYRASEAASLLRRYADYLEEIAGGKITSG